MSQIDKRSRMEPDTWPASLRFITEESGEVVVKYSGFDSWRMTRAEWDDLPIWNKNGFAHGEIV